MGATAHIQTFAQDDGGAHLTPQVLTGITQEMAVMCKESFGPVVGIMPVKEDGEAVALMNASPYGLTASLWTADIGRTEAVGDRIETGTVFMNRADYLDPAPRGRGARTPAGTAGCRWSPITISRARNPFISGKPDR